MKQYSVTTTRLTIPPVSPVVVPRPHLVERFQGLTWRLAVVAAPAGLGKSVLLSSWASSLAQPPAWFSCTASDAEPTRFWTGLAASLSARWPGVGDDAQLLLGRSTSEELAAAESLASELARLDRNAVIVIDDLHLARPTPEVLTTFIGSLPPGCRLVLGSRRQLPFSLARRRAAGDVLELGHADLRFTEADTDAVLRARSVELGIDDVRRLQEVTEGWPAAVSLATVSLGRASVPGSFIDTLASNTSPMADFLVSEVLDTLADDVVEFLLATSVFDEFDADLCERLTGRDDAGRVIDQLVEQDLFIVRLDADHTWFRYHHLFDALLQARLRARGDGQLLDHQHRAVTALVERDLVVPAMRLSIAIDDAPVAVSIARRAFEASMHPVEAELTAEATRMWLHRRAADTVVDDPLTVLKTIAALAATTESDDVAGWLALVDRHHPDPPPEVTTFLQGTLGDYHLGQGEFDQGLVCLETARRALALSPSDSVLLPLVHTTFVRALLSCGHVDAARRVLDELRRSGVGDPILDEIRLPTMRAWVAFLDGDLNLAAHLACDAVRRADEWGVGRHEPGRILAALTMARVRTERMDAAAEVELATAAECVEVIGRPWYRWMVHLTQAATARAEGDAARAATGLRMAQLALRRPSPAATSAAALEATLQGLRFGAPTSEVGRLDDSFASSIVRIRCAVQARDLTRAKSLLAALPTPITTRERVDAGMLRVVTAPDPLSAFTALESVLDVAGPESFVRSILEVDHDVIGLLSQFTPTFAHQDDVRRLRDAAAGAASPRRPVEQLVDPLSERELVVLSYLTSRLSNQEMADALFVSVNTLKSHLKAVYRKLGVSSRNEAIDAARAMRLL